MISELVQPELQHDGLGSPLHLALAWLATEPFRRVWKPILEAKFPNHSKPGLRVGGGGGVNVSCQDSQDVVTSSESAKLTKY